MCETRRTKRDIEQRRVTCSRNYFRRSGVPGWARPPLHAGWAAAKGEDASLRQLHNLLVNGWVGQVAAIGGGEARMRTPCGSVSSCTSTVARHSLFHRSGLRLHLLKNSLHDGVAQDLLHLWVLQASLAPLLRRHAVASLGHRRLLLALRRLDIVGVDLERLEKRYRRMGCH